MSVIDRTTSVGRLVRECPARSRIFEKYAIDYCCGGKLSLQEVCDARSLDLASLSNELEHCQPEDQDTEYSNPDELPLTDLCDHIEQTHHAFLRQELPRLDQMSEKVARVHGDREPRLHEIRKAFVELKNELEPHMLKEEQILFPLIRKLETNDGPRELHCGSLDNPIRQMEHEHQHAGDALARIRAASSEFIPPPWACNTYRALLDGLENLEHNMHQHVHKENNILFPKASQLERSTY